MGKAQQTKLRITSCSATYHGKHPSGHSYTIYEVEAVKEDGTPVAEKLRSFEELPLDELLDLSVSRYESAEYGVSYTLSRIGGSGTAKKIKALEERVAALEQTCERLLEMVASEASQHAAN